MYNKKSRIIKTLCSVISLTTVLVLTACSCNGGSGLGQLGGLISSGGSPPDCTHDGGKWYTCTRCGERVC